MNLLLLRGRTPVDRDYREIKHDSIEEEDCIYTHLAYRLADKGEVAYWGRDRCVAYRDNFLVKWVDTLKHYECNFEPDLIIARGGFPEYDVVLKRYPKAFKVYYGAGRNFLPTNDSYDLTLQDSEEQIEIARRKLPHMKHRLWFKPAYEKHFYPIYREKEYDCCFVAAIGADRRKNVEWVYDTCPRKLKILQLGEKSPWKAPENVTIKRVLRKDMGHYMNKCKMGIAPYTKDDSGPRCISEMLACNLRVATLPETRIWREKFSPFVSAVSKHEFWHYVEATREITGFMTAEFYKKTISMDCAVEHLRQILCP